MTTSQAGKKGGTNRWRKVGKKKRSEAMRELALKRHSKGKKCSP